MRHILFLLAFFATSAFATDRVIMNPESNGDLKIKANVGGTATDVVTINGTSGYAQVKGITTNGAACSGCIGENVVSSQITNTVFTGTTTDITGASVALPSAGAWLLLYSIELEVINGNANGAPADRTLCTLEVTTAANATVTGTGARQGGKNVSAQGQDYNTKVSAFAIVNISAATTYKVRGTKTDIQGTGSCQALAGAGSSFLAVRIY